MIIILIFVLLLNVLNHMMMFVRNHDVKNKFTHTTDCDVVSTSVIFFYYYIVKVRGSSWGSH